MKGGITSGMVYPKAVMKPSYKYHHIGGTSARAIVDVAAECGRADAS